MINKSKEIFLFYIPSVTKSKRQKKKKKIVKVILYKFMVDFKLN